MYSYSTENGWHTAHLGSIDDRADHDGVVVYRTQRHSCTVGSLGAWPEVTVLADAETSPVFWQRGKGWRPIVRSCGSCGAHLEPTYRLNIQHIRPRSKRRNMQ